MKPGLPHQDFVLSETVIERIRDQNTDRQWRPVRVGSFAGVTVKVLSNDAPECDDVAPEGEPDE